MIFPPSKTDDRALHHVDFEESTMSFEFTDDHRAMVYAALQPLYLNRARCSLANKCGRDAITWAKKILKNPKDNIQSDTKTKAHFLAGKGYMELGEYDLAEIEFQAAHTLTPEDASIQRLTRFLRYVANESCISLLNNEDLFICLFRQ